MGLFSVFAWAFQLLAAAPASEGPWAPLLHEDVKAVDLGVPEPIQSPPSGDALARFYKALEEVKAGEDNPKTTTREDQLRIVVWGASHTAGDIFTSWIRDRLKERFGDAGLGFLVPAPPWRSYNNRDANITYSDKGWESHYILRKGRREDGRYGLGGITFESSSPKAWAKVETARKNPFGRAIDTVEVWYWRGEKSGDFWVQVGPRIKKRVRTRINARKGERPGLGVWRTTVPLGGYEVTLKPAGNGLVSFFGISLERSKAPGVVMDALGINGARATDQLDWDAGLFTEQLKRRDPDLVVLAYGTNDIGDEEPAAEYGRKLDIVVNRVRSAVPEASCLLIGPSDRPVRVEVPEEQFEAALAQHSIAPERREAYDKRVKKRWLFERRPRQREIIEVQREVAWRYGCGYWDWVGAMGGDMSMLRWVVADEPLAAGDYVHMTRLGYERIASLFWDSLMKPWDRIHAQDLGPLE